MWKWVKQIIRISEAAALKTGARSKRANKRNEQQIFATTVIVTDTSVVTFQKEICSDTAMYFKRRFHRIGGYCHNCRLQYLLMLPRIWKVVKILRSKDYFGMKVELAQSIVHLSEKMERRHTVFGNIICMWGKLYVHCWEPISTSRISINHRV